MKKIIILLLIIVASCKNNIDENVENAMHQYDNLLLHMDVKGIANMFMPDGEMAAPGLQSIRGRDSIEKFLSSFKGIIVQQQKSITDSIRKNRDTTIQYGKYYQRDVVNNSTVDVHGMFKATWVTQPNGKLLLKQMSAWSIDK